MSFSRGKLIPHGRTCSFIFEYLRESPIEVTLKCARPKCELLPSELLNRVKEAIWH